MRKCLILGFFAFAIQLFAAPAHAGNPHWGWLGDGERAATQRVVRPRAAAQTRVAKPLAPVAVACALPAEAVALTVKVVDAAVVSGLNSAAYVLASTAYNVHRAFRFFLDRGYSYIAAAGIVGNLKAESGRRLNTRATGDGGRARGIAQWHPDRQRGLKKHAAATGRDWHDLDVQLEYIDIELREKERLAYERLRAARNLDEATAAFIHYERPRHYTPAAPRRAHNFQGRLRYARIVAEQHAHLDVRP